MSAANVVVQSDRARLITDSAACDGLGRVKRLVSKVRVLPDTRCAISVRGHLGALDLVAAVLPTLGRDVDQLRVAAEDGRLRAALGRWPSLQHGRLALLMPFDVTVVGWGQHGPTAFMFWNHGRMRSDDGVAVEARFAPRDIPWANVLPPVPLPESALRDPLAAMPEIVRRQREHREPSIFLPKGRRFVGGFVEETIVTAHGVETRRAGGWDEPIGQVIGGGDPTPAVRRRIALFLAAVFVGGWLASVLVSIAWQVGCALLSGQDFTW